MDAGKVAKAVPNNMVVMGIVARCGDGAIAAPAKLPTVITRTAAVWNSACALAKRKT
jgi:hypothetical protein